MLYNVNKIKGAKKQLVAVGKLSGKVIELKPKESITVSEMNDEDYNDMISPLFNILHNNKR